MSWTQAQCADCYETDNPGRQPHVVIGATKERCCDCGRDTYDGIYTRKDPTTVNFPRKVEDE